MPDSPRIVASPAGCATRGGDTFPGCAAAELFAPEPASGFPAGAGSTPHNPRASTAWVRRGYRNERTLTLAEAAELSGVKPATVLAWLKRGLVAWGHRAGPFKANHASLMSFLRTGERQCPRPSIAPSVARRARTAGGRRGGTASGGAASGTGAAECGTSSCRCTGASAADASRLERASGAAQGRNFPKRRSGPCTKSTCAD